MVARLIDIRSTDYSDEAGLLIGRIGSHNQIGLGYSDDELVSGLHGSGAAAGLVGQAGSHNRLSVGLGLAQIISVAGQSSGVLVNAGENNTVVNSVIISRLLLVLTATMP